MLALKIYQNLFFEKRRDWSDNSKASLNENKKNSG
jgi:hypothetical protein